VHRGLDVVAAQGAALRSIAGRAALQGLVLAFEKVFLLQGVVFLVILPLLFFLRSDRTKVAHVELSVE
jgi:DHA2 family multidrug resistance protein